MWILNLLRVHVLAALRIHVAVNIQAWFREAYMHACYNLTTLRLPDFRRPVRNPHLGCARHMQTATILQVSATLSLC